MEVDQCSDADEDVPKWRKKLMLERKGYNCRRTYRSWREKTIRQPELLNLKFPFKCWCLHSLLYRDVICPKNRTMARLERDLKII